MRLRGALQVVCTTLLIWMSSVSVASSATRRVVLLFDERPELPGLARLDAEFVRTLVSSSPEPVEVYREAMDLSRFGSDAHKVRLRDYLRQKYADKQIDVTVAILGPALDFLLTSVDPVFPGAAIVFIGVELTHLDLRSLPFSVSGVLVTREFAPTLDVALRLHPMTENVVVVGGRSEFDTKLLEAARKQFQPYEGRLSFRYLTALPMQELLQELSQLPPRTIILYTTFFQDGAGQAFVPHDVAERVSKAASVPVYGFLDQYLGRGIVGGNVYSLTEHGAKAAMLASQVLAGNRSPVLVEIGSHKVLFDWHQLQRWNISESRLPPGSEILFREPTTWESHRWQILAIAAVILLQAALILGLLWEHRRRRRLEVEGRQRMAELAHMNRRATAGQLSASIAHELNQPLGAILNNAEAAALLIKSPSPNLEELETIIDDIKRDDERASKVIKRLRLLLTRGVFDPQEVDLNRVVREVLRIASAQAAAHNVTLDRSLAQQPLRVNGDKVQLQQVVLNLIVNGIDAIAEMPNGVREIVCRSWAADGHALISIRDTGPGIQSDRMARLFEPFFTTKQDGMGMGLCIAQAIIEAHGGKISAESRASGAVFHVSLPLAKT
jgi:signal transduction histidine kinase